MIGCVLPSPQSSPSTTYSSQRSRQYRSATPKLARGPVRGATKPILISLPAAGAPAVVVVAPAVVVVAPAVVVVARRSGSRSLFFAACGHQAAKSCAQADGCAGGTCYLQELAAAYLSDAHVSITVIHGSLLLGLVPFLVASAIAHSPNRTSLLQPPFCNLVRTYILVTSPSPRTTQQSGGGPPPRRRAPSRSSCLTQRSRGRSSGGYAFQMAMSPTFMSF